MAVYHMPPAMRAFLPNSINHITSAERVKFIKLTGPLYGQLFHWVAEGFIPDVISGDVDYNYIDRIILELAGAKDEAEFIQSYPDKEQFYRNLIGPHGMTVYAAWKIKNNQHQTLPPH